VRHLNRVLRHGYKPFAGTDLLQCVTHVSLVTQNRGPFRSRRPERRDRGIPGLVQIELPAGNKWVKLAAWRQNDRKTYSMKDEGSANLDRQHRSYVVLNHAQNTATLRDIVVSRSVALDELGDVGIH
jgi:hypothetical protein